MLHERWSVECVDAIGRALLLRLFDRGTNLGNDIGAEPRGHCEQSRCDLPCALDGEGLGAEDLAPKAYAAPERRRLLRADRYGRLQTDQLGLRQYDLDHPNPPWVRQPTECTGACQREMFAPEIFASRNGLHS